MKLYRTRAGIVVEEGPRQVTAPESDWGRLLNRPDLAAFLRRALAEGRPAGAFEPLAPLDVQEVWAAGVTYYRSRDARVEESKAAGGGDFYSRVYEADRPELFFKSTPHRVAGPGQKIRIRRDSAWNVPEPELVLVVNSAGTIVGYTVGNDVSSRDIEGENPLYLPQAKVYDGSCALGPAVLVAEGPLPPATPIRLDVLRDGKAAFTGSTTLAQLKRDPRQLVEYLFRDQTFPNGVLLFTGTGIVPPADFTLRVGDEVHIRIDPIGTLINSVDRPGAGA